MSIILNTYLKTTFCLGSSAHIVKGVWRVKLCECGRRLWPVFLGGGKTWWRTWWGLYLIERKRVSRSWPGMAESAFTELRSCSREYHSLDTLGPLAIFPPQFIFRSRTCASFLLCSDIYIFLKMSCYGECAVLLSRHLIALKCRKRHLRRNICSTSFCVLFGTLYQQSILLS